MFGIFISDPAQINLEAQAIRLDLEVQKLTEQVSKFDNKIQENLNTFVDYTKLENYTPSEIEIVIPPNFDPKELELEGEVTVEEIDNLSPLDSPLKGAKATEISPAGGSTQFIGGGSLQIDKLAPSTKPLKITSRQTVKQEKSGKADKIAKKFKTKVSSDKFISPSKENGKKLKNKKTEIESISITDLKPLYESLYPSKQALNQLNKEILQEKIGFKKQEDEAKFKKTISAIFEGHTVSADQHTSNSTSALVIYNKTNTVGQWAFDVRDNLLQEGSKIQLYQRSANLDKAQQWKTDAITSRIYLASKTNLCLDASNSLREGSAIHLWTCHNGNNQRWIAHPDGTIRPINNQNFCLDASNGVRNESRIHL
jgi:hypothetical protein